MSTTTNDTEIVLPYHEPDIITILILSSLLILLNVVNYIFDYIIYVGLVGQILSGIAYGTPGGRLIGREVETVIVNLGYLGLLLLVFEGGLATSFKSLKANLILSLCVATTGILLPIGLSYILVVLADATALQAFAAGAALCSTSLGTTFTVLQTSGLSNTRMGVILTSAAMMDDVVGLVMVQVISNLGAGSDTFNSITVVRPVLVSLAFGVAVPIVCRYLVLPLTVWLNHRRERAPDQLIARLFLKKETSFVVHTIVLIAMVTGATYAGTSNLFAAYLAGAAISWWDSDVPHDIQRVNYTGEGAETTLEEPEHKTVTAPSIPLACTVVNTNTNSTDNIITHTASSKHVLGEMSPPSSWKRDSTDGKAVFTKYYHQPLQRVLKPFFFASIGFSIPITRMFTGAVAWRGIVYTILMCIGKMVCGLWLIRFEVNVSSWLKELPIRSSKTKPDSGAIDSDRATTSQSAEAVSRSPQQVQANSSAKLQTNDGPQPLVPKPTSLYPGTIVGSAMIARGEIGFLISSLAESNGIFGREANSELFLIVTWAILLCTIIGPVMVGVMVRRLKALESSSKRGKDGEEKRDVLGVWGLT